MLKPSGLVKNQSKICHKIISLQFDYIVLKLLMQKKLFSYEENDYWKSIAGVSAVSCERDKLYQCLVVLHATTPGRELYNLAALQKWIMEKR